SALEIAEQRFDGLYHKVLSVGIQSGKMAVEETGLGGERFSRLRQVETVPKAVRHGVEDHEAGIDTRAQQGAMKVDRAAETVVAGRGHAEGGRKALEIRINGRKHRIG